MGSLDTTIHQLVTPLLAPGETLLGTGCFVQVRTTLVGGVPQDFALWLAAFFPTRMVLFKSEAQRGLMGAISLKSAPSAQVSSAVSIGYATLDDVTLGTWPGNGIEDYRRLSLAFRRGLFPEGIDSVAASTHRFDEDLQHLLSLALAPQYEDLQGQAQTWAQFPAWLQSQVKARAFPLTASDRARLDAVQVALATQAAQTEAQRAARDAWWKGNKKRVLAGALTLVCVLGAIGSGVIFSKHNDAIDTWEQTITLDREVLRLVETQPSSPNLATDRARAESLLRIHQHDLDEARTTRLLAAVALVICLGLTGLAARWTYRQRPA